VTFLLNKHASLYYCCSSTFAVTVANIYISSAVDLESGIWI